MKKKSVLICALLFAFLLVGMTGCGGKKEQTLTGSYTSQGLLNQMNYTFDEEKNVTVRFLVGGYPVSAQSGTYELSEDGSIITFTFPAGEEGASANLPSGMTSLGGAFSFKQEEDCIWIGTACYQKDTVGTGSDETGQPNADASSAGEESVPLSQIHLTLPETYALSYEVTEESAGISRTYTQSMTCTDTGVFLELGDSNEKYVFEKLEGGKYTEYRYNTLTGKYETPLISPALQAQIDAGTMTVDSVAVDSSVVAGYTARVDTYFDFYEEFRSHLTYQGQEPVEGAACQKYAASFTTVSGKQAVILWIDPQTGLCMKGIYQYEPTIGVPGTKAMLCTGMKTENVALPDYP